MKPASAKFVEGSIARHVVVMAGTGAVGLIAVFAVDLLNLFYLSLLGDQEVAAAIGFAGVIGFFQTSIGIGLTIAISAVVSRRIGAGRRHEARRGATAASLLMLLVMAIAGLGVVVFIHPILNALGATGRVRELAQSFLVVVSPSAPLIALGMVAATLLRCNGDARWSTLVTIIGAITAAVLDPILIFGLHLGLTGAAISTVIARAAMGGFGLAIAQRRYGVFGRFERAFAGADLRAIAGIAAPAVLTNLATPVGNAFVTHSMAAFGAQAVAAQATIDRITPVAFGLIFALTGAVGPIIGQNVGAGRPERVMATLRAAFGFVLTVVLAAWAVLAMAQGLIIRAFSIQGDGVSVVRLFCDLTAGSFIFLGCLFVANAAFNNLGRSTLATLFNWGRATIGTIPLVAAGAAYGPVGILLGQAIGDGDARIGGGDRGAAGPGGVNRGGGVITPLRMPSSPHRCMHCGGPCGACRSGSSGDSGRAGGGCRSGP
jgi:putative MATE family efflux protein